jgi:hypothetical protein
MTALSLNELGFTVRWAASGAGVPIGLAEELAQAAKAIGQAGLDPARVVSAALGGLVTPPLWGGLTIDRTAKTLALRAGRGGRLMAIEAGPVLADAMMLSEGATGLVIQAQAIDHPLLASACLTANGLTDQTIRCHWKCVNGEADVIIDGGQIVEISANDDTALYSSGPADLKVAPDQVAPMPADFVADDTIEAGLIVPDASWRRLLRLASASWVPSNEASRLTGAGAGLIDTD